MRKMNLEDEISIAVLLNYAIKKSHIIDANIANEFADAIENKMIKFNIDEFKPVISKEDIIYIDASDEHGNDYYLLNNDFDYERIKKKYLYYPKGIYNIIAQNDILNILGLEIENGEIRIISNVKKENYSHSFEINFIKIALLISKLYYSLDELDKLVKKELWETYIYGMNFIKENEYHLSIITVYDKPHLYNYLIEHGIIEKNITR